jgi:hypothetical protein
MLLMQFSEYVSQFRSDIKAIPCEDKNFITEVVSIWRVSVRLVSGGGFIRVKVANNL